MRIAIDSKDAAVSAGRRSADARLSICILGFLLILAGCKSQALVGKAPDKIPTYQQIAEAQNKRIAQLKTISADGVIEIHWKDEKGNHSHQGGMELWVKLPRHTALRVEKLGEVLLWLGSDDDRYWLFDMVNSDEKVLHTASHDDASQPDDGDAGVLGVKPLALLDLMGLTPLQSIDQNPPAVTFDAKLNAWAINIEPNAVHPSMRVYFEPSLSFHTVRVESLDAKGKVVLTSSLKRYDSVKLQGMSPAAFPKIPQLIDITGVSGVESGEVKIVINEASGIDDDETLGRVFDLNRLIKGLRPDRIEGVVPPAPAATASSNGKGAPGGGNGTTP